MTPCSFPFSKVEDFCKLVKASLFQKSLIGRVCDPEPFLKGFPFPPFSSSNHPRSALQQLPMLTAPRACRTIHLSAPRRAGVGAAENSVCSFLCELLPARAAHVCCCSNTCSFLSNILRNFSLEHSRKYPCLHQSLFWVYRRKTFKCFI